MIAPTASRLIAFLCFGIALLAVATKPLLALLFAFLIPFWFFLTQVVDAPLPSVCDICRSFPFPSLPVFSPRPPPLN
jgi:hypothetical protein